MSVKSIFTKRFNSLATLSQELSGYYFTKLYFKNITKIISVRTDNNIYEIDFEKIDTNSDMIVTDSLVSGIYVDLSELFLEFAEVTNRNLRICESEGGTVLFYLNRLVRLRPEQSEDIMGIISNFNKGFCTPSQGDFHERNISANGYLLDYEGAGWNLLSGDIATFVWHTLFAGNYFGPRYANWSSEVEKEISKKNNTPITFSNGSIDLNLGEARRKLTADYIDSYLNKLSFDLSLIDRDICAAIAFRILTVFPVDNMDTQDQTISHNFVNLFMDKESNLNQKLHMLSKNLPELHYKHN